jgi:signal transduction histidine kinase
VLGLLADARALHGLPRLGSLGVAGGALLLSIALAQSAYAACLPILDRTLSSLEAQMDQSPSVGFAQAKQLLSDSHIDASPLRKASVLAILSSASVETSRPEDVRQAITEAREILLTFPASERDEPEIKRIRSRLLLDEVLLAVTPEEHRAAIPRLDQLIASTPMISEERACALIARSQKHSDLHEQERAASDALTAYRIAVEGHFEDARIDAAIVLAIAYRRSGLYDAGERMIREPIDAAEQRHRPSALAVALYTYSQILIGMRRYPEASAVALRAREAYRQFADAFGDALTEQTLCHIEIELGNYREAAEYCHEHDVTFAAAHREDLISMELAYQSRLALKRGDIAGADRLIEKSFGLPSGFRSPAEEIELLESRAQVEQAEGHDKAAAADLRRVIAITRENSAAERARAITLLAASAEADRLLAANKLLVAQTERQQVEIQNHQLERRLRVTIGGVGAALATLFCYVYWSRARYERAHAAEARIADVFRTSGILRRANERLAAEPDLAAFMAHVLRELCSMSEADAAAAYENRIDVPYPVLVASYPEKPRRSWLDGTEATDDVASEERRRRWHALLAAKDVITLEATDHTRLLPSQWIAWLDSNEYQRALAIPLLSGDLADGFILLAFTDSIHIDAVRMEFVKFLAQQAMIAIRLTQLSEMMSRTAMLEERTRLARDLHDTMAQSFTGIYMQLQAASRYAESNQSLARACIERAQTLARDGLREARQSVLALTSRGKTMDVTAAVTAIAQVTSTGTACPCTVIAVGESRPIDSLIGGNVVAICREAISNAQRYAQATEIAITVTYAPGELCLRIQDNGEGFAVPEASQSGFGLTGMQARGERIGGTVKITSTPGAGTTVEVRVPTISKPGVLLNA